MYAVQSACVVAAWTAPIVHAAMHTTEKSDAWFFVIFMLLYLSGLKGSRIIHI